MGVRIVTDGAADLPQELVDSLGIEMVRGAVQFGPEVWDGSPAEFWTRIRTGSVVPSSRPPSVEAFAAKFVGSDPVCAVLASSELSRTVEHAKQALSDTGAVHVVDSRSLSIGTGLIATTVARAVATDAEFDQVKRLARRLVDEVHVYVLIEDVEYLVRGGRTGLVDRDARRAGRQILAVRGHAIPLERVKDRVQAIRQLLRHVADVSQHGIDSWAVAHGDADDAIEFTGQAEKILGQPPAYVVPIGPSVGAHAGPDALVLGFLARLV